MFAAIAAFSPSAGIMKLIAIGLVILTILGVIYAGYRYVENTQNALVQSTSLSATRAVEVQVSEASGELLRQKAKVTAEQMTKLSATDQKNDSEWDAADAATQAIVVPPTMPARVATPTPVQPVNPTIKEDSNVVQTKGDAGVAAAIASLNAQSDLVDGMLERASGRAAAKAHH